MEKSFKHPIFRYVETHRIHFLLILILSVLFIPPFLSENSELVDNYIKIDFLLIVMACFLIIRRNKFSRYFSFITFTLIAVNYFIENDALDYLSQIGLTILIFNAFILVLKEAMSLRGDTKNLILVSITGYLIIGLVGGFFSAWLDNFYPGSFHHSTGMKLDLFNFIYYGIVTMTTLGYGDIIPVNDKSQALSLMLVISGQLFLSVIIALNIAKIMQKKP